MAEPLACIDKGNVMVAAGKQGIQEQGVNVLLKLPAVQLHGKFITQHKDTCKRTVLLIKLLKPFRSLHKLHKPRKFFIGYGQVNVGYDMYHLFYPLFTGKVINMPAIVLAVFTRYVMHGRKGFTLTEQAAVTDKLACPAQAPFFTRHPLKAIGYSVVNSLQGVTQG